MQGVNEMRMYRTGHRNKKEVRFKKTKIKQTQNEIEEGQ